MYFVLMQYMSPRWKGIKSYLPERYNKKRVPNIWRRLQGYKLPGEEDWMVADRDKVAKIASGDGIKIIKNGVSLEAKHPHGQAHGEVTNGEGLLDWLDENGFYMDAGDLEKETMFSGEAKTFLLLDVEVEPRFRGMGLGKKLVGDILTAAQKAGAQSCYLHASPLDQDTSIEQLYSFYGNMGFEPYLGHEYIMYKELTGPQLTAKRAWKVG